MMSIYIRFSFKLKKRLWFYPLYFKINVDFIAWRLTVRVYGIRPIIRLVIYKISSGWGRWIWSKNLLGYRKSNFACVGLGGRGFLLHHVYIHVGLLWVNRQILLPSVWQMSTFLYTQTPRAHVNYTNQQYEFYIVGLEPY